MYWVCDAYPRVNVMMFPALMLKSNCSKASSSAVLLNYYYYYCITIVISRWCLGLKSPVKHNFTYVLIQTHPQEAAFQWTGPIVQGHSRTTPSVTALATHSLSDLNSRRWYLPLRALYDLGLTYLKDCYLPNIPVCPLR